MNDEEQQKVDAIMRAIDVLNAAISDLPDAHMIVLNAHELYDGAQKVDGAWIRRITDFSGGAVSACAVEGGDTGDDNGLLTTTSVFTGVGAGITQTTGAAEFARHEESSFVPTFTITTVTANVDQLTAGELDYFIRFQPNPSALP